MIIYMIKNSENGKIYIGQTKSSLKKRFSQHCEKRNNSAIGLAIKKYGKSSFELSILCRDIKTREELNRKEIEFISLYRSIAPNGYNIEKGGNASKMAEETKNKIREKLKGRSVTWSKKVSEGLKKIWKDEEYRKRQTKQRHEKRGKYKSGIVRESKTKKIDIENLKKDYQKYMNLSEMSKKYNISVSTIYQIIKIENIEKRGYKCNKKKV